MDDGEFATWIDPLRAGRPDAVAWMFANFRGDVERCFGRRPPEDRADLVQDVFAVAITRLHTFEGDREATLRAWLRSIAFHRWHHRWEAKPEFGRGTPVPLWNLSLGHIPATRISRPWHRPVQCGLSSRDGAGTPMPAHSLGRPESCKPTSLRGAPPREIASDWGVP